MKITIPSHLSDADLVAEVKSLAGRERAATGHLTGHLAELDARRLYLGAGFSSLFTYCMEVLRLSEAEAYNRIEAARAARRFPVILDRLAEGSLNITTIRVLASCLTGDNHLELLAAASGKSRREVEELLAQRFPQPDVASSVRKLPTPRPVPGTTHSGCEYAFGRHDVGGCNPDGAGPSRASGARDAACGRCPAGDRPV